MSRTAAHIDPQVTADPAPAKSRRGVLTVAVLTLAAFGPYIAAGFRTEQVAVYGAFTVLAVAALWVRMRPNGSGALVSGLLGTLLLIAAVGVLAPPQNTSPYPFGSALAGLDNLALPLVVLLIVWTLAGSNVDLPTLIRVVCSITVWAMIVNAALAACVVAGFGPDLTSFYGLSEVQSVAERAATMGRYSGIFNQPAEAGLMYSIALLAAIYVYRRHAVKLALVATILTVGGALTVSKVFLLIGLPVGIWQVLRASGGRVRRVAAVATAGAAGWAAVSSGLTPTWAGSAYILRLLPDGNQDTVDLYTAGRFGGQSTLSSVVDAVMSGSPVLGYGAAGLQVPYDNAWVEALVMAGLVGVIAYTAILVVLVLAWLHTRRVVDAAHSRLAGGLIIVVVAASTGIPALTANRCATVIWLLLGLLLLTQPRAAGSELRVTHKGAAGPPQG